MGTRSLTTVRDIDGNKIFTMYRQYDGYPKGHGADLKELLEGYEIVNGIKERRDEVANGMDCLAAQLISRLKMGGPGVDFGDLIIGGIYLRKPEEWEENDSYFKYDISPPDEYDPYDRSGENLKGKDLHLTVTDFGGEIYDGRLGDFNPSQVGQ